MSDLSPLIHEDSALEIARLRARVAELEQLHRPRPAAEDGLYDPYFVLQNIGDAIILVDDKLRIRQWNRAAETIYGWRAEEVRGELVFSVIPIVRYLDDSEEIAFTALRHDSFWSGKVVQRCRDGRELIIEASAQLIRDAQGEVVGIASINRDVTAQIQMEQVLQASQHFIQQVAETSTAILYVYDLVEQRNVFANQQIAAILGYTPAEVQAMGNAFFQNLLHPDDLAHVASHTQRIMQARDGEIIGLEYRMRDASGEWRWLYSRDVVFLRRPTGEPRQTLGTAIDITERKHGEEALRQALAAEQRAHQFAETLRAGNLALTRTLDLDTILETLLIYLEQLVPYDSANVLLLNEEGSLAVRAMRGYEGRIDPDRVQLIVHEVQHAPILAEMFATKRSVLVPDTRDHSDWVSFPATQHILCWFGVPLLVGGTVIGLYSVDKTEANAFTELHVRQAETLAAQAAVAIKNAQLFAEVQAAREQLQTLSSRLIAVQEAERRSLARELHDEIGQVLTGLSLALTVGPHASPAVICARLAEAQHQVNALTTQVRTLSLDLRPAMLDDMGLLPALLWYFKRYTTQTQVRVNFRHMGLEQRFPPDVEIAAYRIVQEALTNVARHAGVATATVQIWAVDGWLQLQIEDQGRGFDVETMLASYTSSGLTGMRERARLLGGTLTIESAPGVGARILADLRVGAARLHDEESQ